ncbi:peptidylprolyl isomerase [Shewanella sp. NIFS-20-20]|uniref:peptidylprolyl isomerase n=1 Tax=Shewanella sp. NIFS-20-20 TaxID=2853806 RepID=UPI001C436871|nr:peptidylprolyl isomerase [Shewanella sp. NIFS-20-20]MBV7316525.1 peptidylprolyl isomerase [Shewanella sp. NIFS-20-20]
MHKTLLSLTLLFSLSACDSDILTTMPPTNPDPNPAPPMSLDVCYTMTTTLGDIGIAIDTSNTPITGNNFVRYVEEGFYEDTIFHRVVHNFVVQGGGFSQGLVTKPTHAPILNEAKVGFSNERGTLAMARTNAPHSADSQFFINVLDNPQLNASASSAGYAVFGRVIEGMEVVDQINIVPVTNAGVYENVPITDILITEITERSCR